MGKISETDVIKSENYFACHNGIVYSRYFGKEKIITLRDKGDGYLKFNAYTNAGTLTMIAHRFVWQYFFGDIPKGKCVNHLNFDRADNRIENLELVSFQENIDHAVRAGRFKKPEGHGRGTANGRARLTEDQVLDIEFRLTCLEEKPSHLAREFNVGYTAIADIKSHKSWSHLWGREAEPRG